MFYSVQCLILVAIVGMTAVECHLRDKAHKIYIGTAIADQHLGSDATYRTIAAQEFNCVTPENSMKWDAVEGNRGHPNYSAGDRLVAFAQQNGMKIRGHTLVWHSQLPGWVQGLGNNRAVVEQVMKQHITDEMTHFKGKIYAWDVLNEIFNEDGSLRASVFHNAMGNDFVAEAFRTAHAVDPNAKLYINDYNIDGHNRKSDGMYNLVKSLKAQGVPVHGVGFQSHFGLDQIPQDYQSNLQRFSDLGVDVAITELDISMKQTGTNQQTLQRQANDYAKVFNACLSVQRCVGVTIWGFADKYSWIGGGNACLWDNNMQPKPAVNAINNVLK